MSEPNVNKVEAKNIPPSLTSDDKRDFHAKHRLGIEDKFYVVSKIAKGKHQYSLKNDKGKVIKRKRKTNHIIFADNLSTNYLIDKLIDLEKRLAFNDNKQQKTKNKIKKIVNDINAVTVPQWNWTKWINIRNWTNCHIY
ncbi:MAG: hypothetical protein Ta2E_01130 [Mycoplasmoidaceae bacterium]|nr:MAG: hypothetical protein Ta2E_01130 [Mycoplasmoidaceae bacterium]